MIFFLPNGRMVVKFPCYLCSMSKRILITGASSGIGLETANLLAAQGHRIIASARRAKPLEQLVMNHPNHVIAVVGDVCNIDDVQRMVQASVDAWGGLDVLINNAGLGVFDPLIDAKLADWHTMIDVNIKGLLNCVHFALPELRKNQGQIVNLASVAAHHVFPNSGIYCSTKHAVLAISESLRLELSSELRLTTISPGSVNTPFIEQTRNEDLLQNYRGSFAAGLDARNIAEQIAYAVNAPENTVISEIIIRPKSPKK